MGQIALSFSATSAVKWPALPLSHSAFLCSFTEDDKIIKANIPLTARGIKTARHKMEESDCWENRVQVQLKDSLPLHQPRGLISAGILAPDGPSCTNKTHWDNSNSLLMFNLISFSLFFFVLLCSPILSQDKTMIKRLRVRPSFATVTSVRQYFIKRTKSYRGTSTWIYKT